MPAQWHQRGLLRQHQCLQSLVYPVHVFIWAGHCASCGDAQAFAEHQHHQHALNDAS